MNMFTDIGVMVVAAVVCGIAAKVLKQPTIIGYILAGIVIGPQLLGLINNTGTIAALAELGIAFLLFIVGLEIRLDKLKETGMMTTVVGIVQVIATAGITYFIFINFADKITALYFGVAAAFSSTMIVIKLLSDIRETDTPHGRIILGMLLVQDFFAILVLSLLPNLINPTIGVVGISILKGAAIAVAAFAAGRMMKPVMEFAARQQELLLMTALAWCLAVSALAVYLGYSIAIGAFFAGMGLAYIAYNLEIAAKIKPLRDFFALIFFVALGMQLIFRNINPVHVILLVISVIIIKTAITAAMLIIRQKKATVFKSAGALAQVSEFSLIIGVTGTMLGHISKETLSVIAIATVLTAVLTSYFIEHSGPICRLIGGRLPARRELPEKSYDTVLCGYNRIGYSVLKAMRNRRVVVIDYNPEVIKKLKEQGVNSICADASEPELIESLNLRKIKMLVSTLPNEEDNMQLIRKTREENRKAIIIVTASQIDEALRLYKEGADYVITPHFLGGNHASLLMQRFEKNPEKILKTRVEHLQELQKRKKIGQEHPR